jgi:transcription initiation factor TFIIB
MNYNNTQQTKLGETEEKTTWGSEASVSSTNENENVVSVTTATTTQSVIHQETTTIDDQDAISETWNVSSIIHKPISTVLLQQRASTSTTIPSDEKCEKWSDNSTRYESVTALLKSFVTIEKIRQNNTTSSSSKRRELKPISNHAKKHAENSDTSHTTDENEFTQKDKSPKTSIDAEIITESCPECDSDIVHTQSEQYCDECGTILADENIDPGPEWRAFNHSEQQSKSRVGEPVSNTIHDKGLSTVIGNDNKDAKGGTLSNKKQNRMNRLRKWDKRFKVKDTKERNMRQAFGEIQRLTSEMELADYIEETACTIYRKALDEELLPGRSIESMTSASVYIAMRQAGVPKTLESLLQYCRVNDSRVTGAYSYISKELGIEIQPPEVSDHLSRISSELSVSKETEREAKQLLEDSVDENIHSGKDPSGMAASAVYAATMITRNDRVTQEEASKAGDVCELTIRNRNRELLKMRGLDHDSISPPSKKEIKK